MEQAIKNKREMDIEIERSLGGSDGDSRLLSAFLGGERGYFLMGLSELAKENPEILPEEKRDGTSIPVFMNGGTSGAKIMSGFLKHLFSDYWINLSFSPMDRLGKDNLSDSENNLELKVMQPLSKDPRANVASVSNENGCVSIERLKGPTLFNLAYFDYNGENKENIKKLFADFIKEAMHIDSRISHENILDDKEKLPKDNGLEMFETISVQNREAVLV